MPYLFGEINNTKNKHATNQDSVPQQNIEYQVVSLRIKPAKKKCRGCNFDLSTGNLPPAVATERSFRDCMQKCKPDHCSRLAGSSCNKRHYVRRSQFRKPEKQGNKING